MKVSGSSIGVGQTPNSGYRLDVNGSVRATEYYYSSDARYKTNTQTFTDALDAILNLRGVTFNWNLNDFREMNFSESKQIGFIAQEVEKVLPELVHTDPKGYKSVAYANVIPVLVEAVKSLKTQKDAEINSLRVENAELRATLADLLKRLEALENTGKR